MANKRVAIVPDVVVDELSRGAQQDSRLRQVLDADWIERRSLVTDEEIEAFARFSALLVTGSTNRGEADVLALASVTGGFAGGGRWRRSPGRPPEEHRNEKSR